MPSRVLLLTPARRFIANRFGVGYQIPLGMVFIGGPLADAGHTVRLLDNDLYGWGSQRLLEEVRRFSPDVVLIGHTGSTAAHGTCVAAARLLKQALPAIRLVYGGVYPTYAADSVMQECPEIDVVVRGEGEATTLDLLATWEQGASLATVEGISWRDGMTIHANHPRAPIANLDAYRPGWELVDWNGYTLFGMGRSAGMQFSRGCPLTCTHCGQWSFWRRWRHRSPENVVSELRTLREQYGVQIVWFADENFAADRAAVTELLERIIEADLELTFNVNMTAADVVRDIDLLPLYKAAGVDYIILGIEALDDAVVASVRKNNPYHISRQAIQALRKNNIFSWANIIYGLEDETVGTVVEKFRRSLELDPDVLNACYLTPHFWTAAGRATVPADVIQTDMAKWTYRNQVIAAPHLSPAVLFIGVKLTEMLFHLRPRALSRLLSGGETRVRRLQRATFWSGVRVVAAEIADFVFNSRFAPRGTLKQLYGAPTKTAMKSIAPEPAPLPSTHPVDAEPLPLVHSSQ